MGDGDSAFSVQKTSTSDRSAGVDRQDSKKIFVLYDCDTEKVQGWFAGTVQGGKSSGLPPILKRTNGERSGEIQDQRDRYKALNGNVACELSAHLYGANQWWVLKKM